MDLLVDYLDEKEAKRAGRLAARLTRLDILEGRAAASKNAALSNVFSLERRRRQMEYDLFCLKSQERAAIEGDTPAAEADA